ncbi:MAG: hypothetical protein SH868_06720 [Bythopirellula sp.]|nr:hypothetical protein [Bythopirellula sp.]
MKHRALLCTLACTTLLSGSDLRADDVVLTLDLSNTYRDDPRSGGTWQLFARRVETGQAPQGDAGLCWIRALINNIRSDTITFAPDIGQMTAGGPFINTLKSGTVEILYQQDTDGTVVKGIGIAKNPHRDHLIASGSWPPGPRPNFGDDGATPPPATSSAKFLGAAKTPFPEAVIPGQTVTEVITLGDLNENGTVTNSDIAQFTARLPGASPSLPYHPAGDIDQSGTITTEDRELLISILSGP